MSLVYDYDDRQARSLGSNVYSDWMSPSNDDSSRLEDKEDDVKEQEYWRNLVYKALKQGNDESVVSSTQDESDVISFSLEKNPDLDISYVWSVRVMSPESGADSSVEPDNCVAESSFASAPSSLANVPFVSLDISLEEPTTTTPLVLFDHRNLPRPSHVASPLSLPLSIPSFIYIPYTAVNTTSEAELLDIYDPTELLIYQPGENSWPEPVHRLHQLLQKVSQSSYSSDDNQQNLLKDILTCIQEYPETCQIRYSLPRSVDDCSQSSFSDSGYYFPLTYFCLLGCLEGIQVVYQACPEVVGCINDPESGWIPLAFACLSANRSKSRLELIQYLLSVFPDGIRRTTFRTQQTILHSLCQWCPDPDVVRLLLEHYPKAAQLPDSDGFTPVMYLCRNTIHSSIGDKLWPMFWNTSPLTVQAVTPQTMEKLLHIACRYNIHQYALIESILTEDPSQCQYTDRNFQLPIHKAIQGYVDLSSDARKEARRSMQRLVQLYPEALEWRDDHDETPRDIFLRLFRPLSAMDEEEREECLSLADLLTLDSNS